jgi:hypothetical protein
MSQKPISRPQLDGARQRLERWRKEHGGTGRAIPEELWDEAARVAREEGIAETARALRLDRYRLARRAEMDIEADASAGAGFVER